MPVTHDKGEESPDFQQIHFSWTINKVLKSHMTPGDNGIGYSNKRQIFTESTCPYETSLTLLAVYKT